MDRQRDRNRIIGENSKKKEGKRGRIEERKKQFSEEQRNICEENLDKGERERGRYYNLSYSDRQLITQIRAFTKLGFFVICF